MPEIEEGALAPVARSQAAIALLAGREESEAGTAGGAAGALPDRTEALVFARSTTFQGDPMALDAGIAFVTDKVMPMITAIDGCTGLSMMVDRDTGGCIVTSSWQNEETMRASDAQLIQVRADVGEIVMGDPEVEEWEMCAMHRDHLTHAGTCCRVVWLRTDHADIDHGIDVYKHGVLPEMEALDGFCSASLMLDRSRSRACATTSFDSADAMAVSRERSWAIRDAGVREAGVDVIDVAEFDLAIAHLRVPELV